jgi:hypothetical protein
VRLDGTNKYTSSNVKMSEIMLLRQGGWHSCMVAGEILG